VVYGSLDAFKADIEQARAALAAEIANLDLGRPEKNSAKLQSLSRSEAAEKLDVSARYVNEAKKIQRESPEHFDKVKSGELSLQQADPEVEPLPFSRDVADKLEHYCISRDQWRKETLGGDLVAVRFSELIDQVDGEARRAVLKIPAPEVFSTNLALKQVLANRPSGLKMLGRWSA
jgi:hypothetical protein